MISVSSMVRLPWPYFRNTKNRLVQSPKIYLRDTGLLRALLGLRSWDQLCGNAIIGSLSNVRHRARRYVVAPLPEPELIPIGRDTVLCRPDSLLEDLRRL